jgi:hypothetical protein
MSERRIAAGDFIYREGDRADFAALILAGRVDLLQAGVEGDREVAELGPGEIIGELGLVLNQRHAQSARARDDVRLRVLDRWSFLNTVNGAPEAMRPLLKALLGKCLELAPKETPGPAAPAPTPEPEPSAAPRLRILPASDRLKAAMEAIEVERLPFRVGRLPVKGEIVPTEENDLAFADEKPFNLSRRHFIIEHTRRGLILRDCGSHLGTLVNGVRIGLEGAEANMALLQPGGNEVIAGGESSPFRFMLEVG